MLPNILMYLAPFVLIACTSSTKPELEEIKTEFQQAGTVGEIALPGNYKRRAASEESFSTWLRKIKLKNDNRVFLYNGRLKGNQEAQFAVLNIPVGNKDLQQCADAVMRLRAEYLRDANRVSEISFADNNGKKYRYNGQGFQGYLETVFTYCGTLSLEKQMKKVRDFSDMQAGDVLIQGGSPGHAVIVMDIAEDKIGKKIYLLAQSYMPAQDIHILQNPLNPALSPWYEAIPNSLILTPEWRFHSSNLRTW